MLAPLPIASGDGFARWQALNDTIMGGRSRGGVQATSAGLVLEAFVEPEGGGFVSCRSPVLIRRWISLPMAPCSWSWMATDAATSSLWLAAMGWPG